MSREAMKLALERLQSRTDTADLDAIAALNKALAEQPAQQEPVPCCGKYETCTQACTPRGRFLGKREALAEQPAQHECRCNQGQVCHVCDPIHAAQFG
jgi:ribonucleotide monophosphatase NagD (HAD superfamily)